MTAARVQLGAALEAALLRALAESWAEIARTHFGRQMKPPTLELSEGEGRLGAWIGARRTLALSRALVLEQPWSVVREVLKHEMAHQFVDEVLGHHDETAHGPTFEAVCARAGIDAAAAGLPAPHDDVDKPVLRRIAKLLALADSPNQHEAELAMRQAQRLMLKHNIDEALATAREGFTFRQLGTPKRRIDAYEQILAGLLGAHFFVQAIWVYAYLPFAGHTGKVLELSGTRSNLDVAGYVYDFLRTTGERLWTAHKRAHGIRGDRDRRRFLHGVMTGFSDKLRAGTAENRREGLVYAGDPALRSYFDRRHPRRTGGGSFEFHRTAAYDQGRAAGQRIVLHKPMTGGFTGGGSPRLLGAKSPS